MNRQTICYDKTNAVRIQSSRGKTSLIKKINVIFFEANSDGIYFKYLSHSVIVELNADVKAVR